LRREGQALADEQLAALGQDAVEAVQAVADSPELWVELTIQRGQLQYLNNRQFAHSRTDFRDAEDPALKRHMIRYWTRDEGRRSFTPEPSARIIDASLGADGASCTWRTGKREQDQEHFTRETTIFRGMDMRFWLEQAEAEMSELE
jgi:hypothetical protein